ncbi:hypothetical protein SUGI_0107480 [Cryptomeria japonica]|uniref:universal stress protein A-like protein n=1 Tax=Cryptomeria japonica TaxID=3369 RepID=UPI002408B9BE|nr:universal stress protein A-like protein [Cryptomeria japonica]GLJ09367.1 hypothetical protein SUGI_0107480 [Cryptomeria japonica]
MGGSEREGSRIMVAVNESMYALQWTLDNLFREKKDQHIIVMHAETPAVSKFALAGHAAASAGHHVFEIAGRTQNHITQRILSQAKEICEKGNVSIEMKVVIGETRYAICEAADEMKVDLLIVGTHGHGAVKRAIVGSVSEYCTRHCKCPVMVVKKPHS